MMGLFNQEKAIEQFGNEKKAEGKLEEKMETAINMKAEGLPEDMIARVLDVNLSIVKKWLSGASAAV